MVLGRVVTYTHECQRVPQCVTLSRITGFLSLRLFILWRICGFICTVSVHLWAVESFCVDGQAQLWPEQFRNLSGVDGQAQLWHGLSKLLCLSAEVASPKRSLQTDHFGLLNTESFPLLELSRLRKRSSC